MPVDSPLRDDVRSVSVVGADRSGTSLAVNLLSDLGFYAKSDNRPPDKFNPQGYGETKNLSEINNRILSIFGGPTLLPTRLPQGWEKDPRLEPVRELAADLVGEMNQHKRWVWKNEPLTLPFWRGFVPPGHRYVICVRNPMASIESQQKALGASRNGAALIWFNRNLAAIRNTSGERRFFLFYDDYFDQKSDQVGRLTDFVGSPAVGSERVTSALRHFDPSTEDCLRSDNVPMHAKLLYLLLSRCKEDPGFAETLSQITDSASDESNDVVGRLELQSKIESYEKTLSHPYVRIGMSLRGAIRKATLHRFARS